METSRASVDYPFDVIAASYDRDFTHTRLGIWLRQLVWYYLEDAFQPGDQVLELGCGTGEDAIWLARRGVLVTATDASTEMLAYARKKANSAGLAGRINFSQWDMNSMDLASSPPGLSTGYAGIFSNFGALNCLSDRRPLAKMLASMLRPGGKTVMVLMSPWCPWEIGWYLVHGKIPTAFRRLKKRVIADIGQDRSVQVWYPSPRRLAREFRPYFHSLKVVSIGSFLPPSYLHHLVERFPRFFAALKTMDLKFGPVFPFSWLTDHYLVVMEKR